MKIPQYSIHGLNRVLTLWLLMGCRAVLGQLDPASRSLVQVGYDQPTTGSGPQAVYAYYHYNNPGFLRTNVVLRLVIAPAYLDTELGFHELISPSTDVGFGVRGGLLGDSHFEVRQGEYFQEESFAGHGGGLSLNLYQRLDPGWRIPLHLIVQGGPKWTTYSDWTRTGDTFEVPEDRMDGSTRVGLRFAGKEPMLYADQGLEVSVWYERQWRSPSGDFGYSEDRRVSSGTDLYWLYTGFNQAWPQSGQQMTFSMTLAGSEGADRLNAWRLGGVLPMMGEFPLALPGYYYDEFTARRVLHFSGSYVMPLSLDHRWQLRLAVATAWVDYLEGFEQAGHWVTGAGPGLSYTSRSKSWRCIVRYGYAVNALRHGKDGAQSVGLLFQYNFKARGESAGP